MKYCILCKAIYGDHSLITCPADKSFLTEYDDRIGQTLDRDFLIEACLGRGGMGIVYLACHRNIGDKVAIKLLKPELVRDERIRDRFRREALAGRSFSHPNAVQVYDLRTADDLFFMVMEYAPGQTLAKQLAGRHRFDLAEACAILEPIGSVLMAAHAAGIIHRDIKPENIVINVLPGRKFLVKLLDFGIAKLREVLQLSSLDKTALTAANEIVGTPLYMSPEQAKWPQRDGRTEIDASTDLYSLALVYYETISGRRPFDGLTRLESTVLTPLRDLVPDVPIAFSDAIQRALNWDRGDRQESVAAFMSELKEALRAPAGPPPQISLNFNPSASASEAASEANAPNVSTRNDEPGEKPTLPTRKEGVISQRITSTRNTTYSKEIRGNTIVIRGLVEGEAFYPLRFLRENLQASDLNLIFSGAFRSLFEPHDCRGQAKWISLKIEQDRVIVHSYPKPILRDEARDIKQVNQLTLTGGPWWFEYWPDGTDYKAAVFTIEVLLSNVLHLVLWERSRSGSKLTLELHYTKKAVEENQFPDSSLPRLRDVTKS